MNPPLAEAPDAQGPSARWAARFTRLGRGLLVCALVAAAATFLSRQFGGPQLLYALLLGMSLNFLASDHRIGPGVEFCSRTVLRLGVALLGARITIEQAQHLGWQTVGFIIAAVALTIGLGVALARGLGWRREDGLLSGGAVAICGVSAVMAISAVLPATKENRQFTLLVVVGVTVLSTVAMVVYPIALQAAGVDPATAGIFLGGTIHDVAQVVAAGTLVGPQAADSATLTKLLRVLMLMPTVLVVALLVRVSSKAAVAQLHRPPAVPGFLLGFAALMLLGSMGSLPQSFIQGAAEASRWALVLAIAASGINTSLAELATLGWKPVLLLLAETLFLAALFTVFVMVH